MATKFPIETSEAQIEVTLPVGTHVLELVVEDSAGLRSEPDTVTITVVGLPAITGFTPERGFWGSEVSIAGRHFVEVEQVLFGGVAAASFEVLSETEISATVPEGAETGRIKVLAGDEEAESETDFVVENVSVSIEPQAVTLDQGARQTFTATVEGSDNTEVEWSVQAGGGSIDAAGVYTAPAQAGTVTIIATSKADPRQSAQATVTVNEVAIEISPQDVSLLAGGKQRFTATVTGTVDTGVSWSVVGGNANGRITTNGLYTAPRTAGDYTVTATSKADESKSASASVRVDVVSVAVEPATVRLLPGQQQRFTATVTGTDNTAVTWSVVEGPRGGTITADGLYTASSPDRTGSFHVRAVSQADPRISASATVIVEVVSVAISPQNPSLRLGQTVQFSATVTGALNRAVDWTATGGSIDRRTGLYRATTVGTHTVTATSRADPSKRASTTVRVSQIRVSISPANPRLSPRERIRFTASVTGTDNQAVVWSASGGSITADGWYTAPATAGSYTVTAISRADRTVRASTEVTVRQVSIRISPQNPTLLVGGRQQFTATVTGTRNTAVIWSATGGSINTSGLYTAPGAPGSYTVTATSQADRSKKASTRVTVTSRKLKEADNKVKEAEKVKEGEVFEPRKGRLTYELATDLPGGGIRTDDGAVTDAPLSTDLGVGVGRAFIPSEERPSPGGA